ncbi:MAG: hypothetical protein GKS07_04985 [Nitrosopumilus sp.]|nr:MAG: hypothetical protein GKS07_04985 [Nitrosopumilus sp.]
MTRQSNKKSVGLTVIMAVLIAVALGFSDMVSEDQAGSLVHEFGEILEGVEAEIMSIPNDTTSAFNTSDTMQTEKIHAEISYLQAFDEVIRKQTL